LFGKSRQAYYQHSKYHYKEEVKTEILLQLVEKERKLMPRLGGRKLLQRIQCHLSGELCMGRDSFFDFLRDEGLLIRKRRNRVRTTYSNHWLHKYPNLIKGIIPHKAHQLWVSDITYIETSEGFGYLNLVTDAYSRKIIGWELGKSLEAKHTVSALQMALNQLPKGTVNVIHHSDRGVQYGAKEYTDLLKTHGIAISMARKGNPYDNAKAESFMKTLKYEEVYLFEYRNIQEARQRIDYFIGEVYNEDRLHSSLGYLPPSEFEEKVLAAGRA
jgi:transposase InsO family protein